MDKKIEEIFSIINTIEYGFKDRNGQNIIVTDQEKWDNDFNNFYYLQTPNELMISKCGVCWDQVELERDLFFKNNIKFKTYFIYIVDNDMLPSHTFLTFEKNHKYYWFEHSWGKYSGVHEYSSEKELLLDVKDKFILEHNYVSKNAFLFIYEYNRPKIHITCCEFYKYIETQSLVKINKPLYFYHLVDKNVDIKKGFFSLQYMYEHKLYDLFDDAVLKYKDRIVGSWNIEKFHGKKSLTREEYLEAINIFRGNNGTNFIYFFRYPPYRKLGCKIEELSKNMNIYRININDEELQKKIIDIFYGYDRNCRNNRLLDRKYYESVTKEDYFSNYDDSILMNFSSINHISISFTDGFCPCRFIEKVDWE